MKYNYSDTGDNDAGCVLLLVGALVLMLFGTIAAEVARTQLERKCLAHGYPSADWRLVGSSYCIKRINQTDVVVAEESLQ